MEEDAFDTVAIAYSQPQALVILSLFTWHGMLAYAANLGHVQTDCPITLALGGIPIRVAREDAAEARSLLHEAAERDEAMLPETLGARIAKTLFFGILMLAPPPRMSATIIGA
ncbi:MAG TPA: hypothetical protein VN029_14680 [Sphingomonas sp.]|nr:hypothetical protein [Sphingomonas sp.]